MPSERRADTLMFTHGTTFRLRLLRSRLHSQSAVASQDRKASVCYPDVSYLLYVSAAPTADMLWNSFVAFYFNEKKAVSTILVSCYLYGSLSKWIVTGLTAKWVWTVEQSQMSHQTMSKSFSCCYNDISAFKWASAGVPNSIKLSPCWAVCFLLLPLL